VTWKQENKPLKIEIADQPGQNPNSVFSKLDISNEAWLSGVTFECVVYHQSLPTPLRDSIHKEKVINPLEPSVSVLLPPTEEISAERLLSLTCLVRDLRQVDKQWQVCKSQ
ncbi:hypothetical protein chiPu_0020793, partial [Chiloscyllium punctatum]|nr:hypothetical protein [Chiloscyllium punctatum]